MFLFSRHTSTLFSTTSATAVSPYFFLAKDPCQLPSYLIISLTLPVLVFTYHLPLIFFSYPQPEPHLFCNFSPLISFTSRVCSLRVRHPFESLSFLLKTNYSRVLAGSTLIYPTFFSFFFFVAVNILR